MNKVLLLASIILLYQVAWGGENIIGQEHEKEKEAQERLKGYQEEEEQKALGGWKGILFYCSTSPVDDSILNQICQRLQNGIKQFGDLASIHVFIVKENTQITNFSELMEKARNQDNPQNLEVYVNLQGASSPDVMAISGEVEAGKFRTLGKNVLCLSAGKHPPCDLQKRTGWFEIWKRERIGYGPPDSNLIEAFSNSMKDHLMELVSKVKKYQAVKDQ